MKNILVLCTGNSARSILAEALFNKLGGGRLRAYSAGSNPKGEVHPASLELLAAKGFETRLFRSKSWDEFSAKDAPVMDIVITVCDSAAGETCPVWNGSPVHAHWGISDPAAVEGALQQKAFEKAYSLLESRIETFLEADIETMSSGEVKDLLDRIGSEGEGATEMSKNAGNTGGNAFSGTSASA